MYCVQRINWQNLLVTDEREVLIDAALRNAWYVPGVAFVTPQHGKPHVVVVGFGMDADTRELAKPLMQAMIERLPGKVRYCDLQGKEITESAWYA